MLQTPHIPSRPSVPELSPSSVCTSAVQIDSPWSAVSLRTCGNLHKRKGTLLSEVVIGELELLFLLFAFGEVWYEAVLFGGDCRSYFFDPPGHAHILV